MDMGLEDGSHIDVEEEIARLLGSKSDEVREAVIRVIRSNSTFSIEEDGKLTVITSDQKLFQSVLANVRRELLKIDYPTVIDLDEFEAILANAKSVNELRESMMQYEWLLNVKQYAVLTAYAGYERGKKFGIDELTWLFRLSDDEQMEFMAKYLHIINDNELYGLSLPEFKIRAEEDSLVFEHASLDPIDPEGNERANKLTQDFCYKCEELFLASYRRDEKDMDTAEIPVIDVESNQKKGFWVKVGELVKLLGQVGK